MNILSWVSFLGRGWDGTVKARRVAGLFGGGNRLWEIGMVGIIGTDVKTVKERRRQGTCFYAPIPYGWDLVSTVKGIISCLL